MKYKIRKQLIPAPANDQDPSWARRQVWVYKLNSNDTVDIFDTREEAELRVQELLENDPSSRIYEIDEVEG